MIDSKRTIPEFFLRNLATSPYSPALWMKRNEQFTSLTWTHLANETRQALGVFQHWGLKPGDRLALIAENRWEWIVIDLACHFAGVVLVPLHLALSAEQCAALLRRADVKYLLHSRAATAMLGAGLQPTPERPFTVVSLDDTTPATPSWSALLQRVSPVELARPLISSNEAATIIFTSGTSNEPRGVMLSGRNLSYNAQAAREAYGDSADERKLNILPFSHAYARTCDLYTWIVRGSQLVLATSRDTFVSDAQAMQPTSLTGVPYLFERLWSLLRARHATMPSDAVLNLLGGKIRACLVGGAPVPRPLFDFFASQGVPLLEGYGLTEASPVITMSTRSRVRPGSCGQALAGVEIKIGADGEILTRGPNVMLGYFRQAILSREALAGGWLHTGDMGTLDDDGYLSIVGRKKDFLVLSTGRKLSPTSIEQHFAGDTWIANLVVVGEGRSCIAALVVPHWERLEPWCDQQGIKTSDRRELAGHPQVRELIAQQLTLVTANLATYEQITLFEILTEPFSVESGELTPKLSLKRQVVLERHAARIDSLYAGEPVSIAVESM